MHKKDPPSFIRIVFCKLDSPKNTLIVSHLYHLHKQTSRPIGIASEPSSVLE